ncbi:hypothetical protein ACFYT3_31775 [Nocardia amikacinitolerans]|uniref:hypothetical protein n=1 Tax=Nocardia amikacinitolerans TaxID=756689 RepID=UPI003688B1D5
MDPIVMAAGTALVSVMATDAWARAKEVVVGWWRRVRPDHAEQVGVELEQLRADAVAARGSGDTATEDALAGVWRLRLHRLVTENPSLRAELERLLRNDLTPLLSAGDQSTVEAITQNANVKGKNNTTVQAGRDATATPSP